MSRWDGSRGSTCAIVRGSVLFCRSACIAILDYVVFTQPAALCRYEQLVLLLSFHCVASVSMLLVHLAWHTPDQALLDTPWRSCSAMTSDGVPSCLVTSVTVTCHTLWM
jgi:hypothetical protein